MIDIRRNEYAIDEIVADGFTLEQMDFGSWAITVETDEGTLFLRLYSDNEITCHVTEDPRHDES